MNIKIKIKIISSSRSSGSSNTATTKQKQQLFCLGGEGPRPTHYLDVKGNKPDKDAAKMMSELRENKVPGRLEKGNWKAYEIDWAGIAGMRYSTTY